MIRLRAENYDNGRRVLVYENTVTDTLHPMAGDYIPSYEDYITNKKPLPEQVEDFKRWIPQQDINEEKFINDALYYERIIGRFEEDLRPVLVLYREEDGTIYAHDDLTVYEDELKEQFFEDSFVLSLYYLGLSDEKMNLVKDFLSMEGIVESVCDAVGDSRLRTLRHPERGFTAFGQSFPHGKDLAIVRALDLIKENKTIVWL